MATNNKCTGNCINCSFQQQAYCAAQRSYAILSYMPAIMERLENLDEKFGGSVFNPIDDKAQKVPGAEDRGIETN